MGTGAHMLKAPTLLTVTIDGQEQRELFLRMSTLAKFLGKIDKEDVTKIVIEKRDPYPIK